MNVRFLKLLNLQQTLIPASCITHRKRKQLIIIIIIIMVIETEKLIFVFFFFPKKVAEDLISDSQDLNYPVELLLHFIGCTSFKIWEHHLQVREIVLECISRDSPEDEQNKNINHLQSACCNTYD